MLTIKQIDAAKPKDKPYRLLDSNGLYLYVPVTGKKVWQLRYKLDGKEKVLTVTGMVRGIQHRTVTHVPG